MKSRLFKIAHSIKGNFASFSDALKHAWKTIRLHAKLQTNNVKFTYVKIDGTVRNSIGTLQGDMPVKGMKPANYGVLVYWDILANAFRSAKIENILFN